MTEQPRPVVSCVAPLTVVADRAMRVTLHARLEDIAGRFPGAALGEWCIGPLRYGLFVVSGPPHVRHTLEGTLASDATVDELIATVALAEPPDGSWAFAVAADVCPACDICRRALNTPDDRDSTDCGGTCWSCMRAAEEHAPGCPRPGCGGECQGSDG
jgi:hypothetical protein